MLDIHAVIAELCNHYCTLCNHYVMYAHACRTEDTCDQFADYLMGMEFHIQTDHKPLVPLFGTKHLDELPLRVQRFRMRLMRYQFTISRTRQVLGYTLQSPTSESKEGDRELQNETEAYVNMMFQAIPATEKRLEEIRFHQEEDDVLRLVMSYCQSGWPERGATV